MRFQFPVISAAEAAKMIQHDQTVGFSGFTPAGAPKAIPRAIAERAMAEHEAGRDFRIGVLTGASTGPSLDGALAKARAISFRTPYQSNAELRARINERQTRFFDMHLSLMPQAVRYGFLGPVHWAVVEACDVTAGGGIVLTSSVGAAPTFCSKAEKILIELNRHHPPTLLGMHDIYEPADPPNRREIPIYRPSDRIGSPVVKVDPAKIVGVVETDLADETGGFEQPTPETEKIGNQVADFLAAEMTAGRIPTQFLPIQSGVGNIANAVLGALGRHPGIPPFQMYTEVLQDSVIQLMKQEQVTFASSCSLTLSREAMDDVYCEPRVVPPANSAAPAGDHEPSGSRAAAGHRFDQHRDRSGPVRKREQHARHGPADDERHRRVGRLHAQRLHFDLHLPVDGEGAARSAPSCRWSVTWTTASTRCRWSPPNGGSPTFAGARLTSARS